MVKTNIRILFIITILTVFSSCMDKISKKRTERAKVKELPKVIEKSKMGSIYIMQPNSDSLPDLDQSEKNRLQYHIQDFYNKRFVPNKFSGSLLVAKNGHIVYEKYAGLSNYEQKQQITPETPLHIASLSKVLTATAILLLIDSKEIELDQKVNTILLDFPYDDITVRTLLNHRTGMRNYSYFTDKKVIWDQRNTLHNSDLTSVIIKNNIKQENKADRRFSYCNTNYAYLALIIENITKMNYREAMQKMIFEPLNMKNTFVYDLERDKKTSSQSYKGNWQRYAINYLDDIYGDKNIYSTPRDLLKFDLATYNANFLNPELLAEVYKGYSYESKGTRNYGLGIRLYEWENGKKMFYHNGWWHGNTSAYLKLKDERTTIICLSNKYTHATYKLKFLSSLFGNYPFKAENEEDQE
jgi:CubicO group peptidase (beta-lactamase class C family)